MYKPLAGNDGGLAGYWRFDEGSGDVAYDATSRLNNAALINMDPASAWAASEAWKIRTTDRNQPLVIYAGYDNDGDALTISQTVEPSNGSLNFDNENIRLTYTPNPGWSGTDNFTFELSDGSDSSSYAIIVIVNPVYTVSYNSNGSTGGNVPIDDKKYEKNNIVTVIGKTEDFVKEDYTFADWNTAANGSGMNYAGGNTFSMGTDDVTLYAQWMSTVIITNQPQNAAVNEGDTATFIVVVSNGETITYQWQKSSDNGSTWDNIEGAVITSYTTGVLNEGDNGNQYRCVLTNTKNEITVNSISNPATLTINVADNLPPESGGNTVVISSAGEVVSIIEDSVQPKQVNIRLQVPTLSDSDSSVPSTIRILSVEGGALQQGNSNAISLGAGGTILSLSGNVIDLRFTPASNQDTDASFDYVVVDAEDNTINSASTVERQITGGRNNTLFSRKKRHPATE